MANSFNLKLYLLLTGIFLIFNLSCEDQDLIIQDLTDETLTYTLSLTKSVCNTSACNDDWIDYNDGTIQEYTLITAELTSFPIDDSGQILESESMPVSGASIYCENISGYAGNPLDSPQLVNPTSASASNVATTGYDGTALFQWADKGINGSFDVVCYYNTSLEQFSSDPMTIEVQSVYKKVVNLDTILDNNNPNNTLSFNLDTPENKQVKVIVTDQDGIGVPGIEVNIQIPEAYNYISADPVITSSNLDNIGEATFTIQVIQTQDLQEDLEMGVFVEPIILAITIENENLTGNSILQSLSNLEVDITEGAQTPEELCDDIGEIKFIGFNTEYILDSDEDLTITTKVLDPQNNIIEGIIVELELSSTSPSADFIDGTPNGEQVTGADGKTMHIIQDIESQNPSVLAPLSITASIPCSENNDGVALYSITETVYIGNSFAINSANISSLNLYLDTNPLILEDGSNNNSVTMRAIIRDNLGNGISGVPVEFSATPPTNGVFPNNNILSGTDGISTNVLQNIQVEDPSIMEPVVITAKIKNPENESGVALFESSQTLQIGDLFAIYGADVASIDLTLDGIDDNTLVLDGTSNSVAMRAMVKDPSGNPVEGIPVSFQTTSNYGTFALPIVLSGVDGIAANIFQNIDTPNESILENIPITVYVTNSENQSIVAQDTETLKVGDLFAIEKNNIHSLDLSLEMDVLILDGTTNSISMQVSVKDVNGSPIEGIPVNFANNSSYGIFADNDILSGTNGTVSNELQNITANIENYSIMQQIPITVSIINPDDNSIIATDMKTLEVGDLFAINMNDIKSLDLVLSNSPLVLDVDGASVTITGTVRDAIGNPVSGIPVTFVNGSNYGTFGDNSILLSGNNGIVTNTINFSNLSNSSVIESIPVMAYVLNPENGEPIQEDMKVLEVGNQIAFTISSINEIDLIVVGSESLILGLESDSANVQSTNNFEFKATVRDANGNPVPNVPVSFINNSNYGTFTNTEVLSGNDGVSTNVLQNIVTPDQSILESMTITAKVFDPSDNTTTLFNDDQTVFVGDQFSYNFNDINSINLLLNTDDNTLILDGISNSITLQAIVSDSNGNPVEGVPVNFLNESNYGVFTSNNVVSGSNGIVQNTLQNIDTPNPSIMTDIQISVSVLNPENNNPVATDTETLQVGNLFSKNINDIDQLTLSLESEILVLDGTTNSMAMEVTVSDENGNPLEGIPVNFSTTSNYVFGSQDNLLSGPDGKALNTLQNIDPDDYDILNVIPITAQINNPENGSTIVSVSTTLYAGNLFALNVNSIDTIDLLLSANSLTLDGSTNSMTMQATVRGADGDPIPGIPVSFSTTSPYGTFLTNNIESGIDGRVSNTIQNIDTPNTSIMENIPIIVKVLNPQDNSTIVSDTKTLMVGDLFAQNINSIDELDLTLSTNTLTLGGEANSITMQATVRGSNGNPVAGVPVIFSTTSSHGTFLTNNVESQTDGVSANTLQNIDTPNLSILESIPITVEVLNPQDNSIIASDTKTLVAGNLFAQNINNIAAVNLLMETNPLILDATNTNEGTDEETNPDEDSDTNEGTGGSVVIIATVKDASGNPLEGVPVNFTNTSSYGIFANSNVISGSNGVASNTLQNIQPDDASIISDIDITVSINNPADEEIIVSDMTTLQVGNQIAFNYTSISTLSLTVDPIQLIINDIPSTSDEGEEADSTQALAGDIDLIASVRDGLGNPISNIPVNFSNSSSYGTFEFNGIVSGQDGVAQNKLQNITLSESTTGIEDITLSANVNLPSGGMLQSNTVDVNIAYQSAINLGQVADLDVALIQSVTTDNNVNIVHQDTLIVNVQNNFGLPIGGVPIYFQLTPSNCTDDNDIIGSISGVSGNSQDGSGESWNIDSSGRAYTSSNGRIKVLFTLTEGDLLTCGGEIINTGISVYVTDDIQENYTWGYLVEGAPNIEYDINIFEVLSESNVIALPDPNEPSGLRDKLHILQYYSADGTSDGSFEHQTIDTAGVIIAGSQVHYEIIGNGLGEDIIKQQTLIDLGFEGIDFGSFQAGALNGELYHATGVTCIGGTGGEADTTGCHCPAPTALDSLNNEPKACNFYSDRGFADLPSVDLIRAYIPDPENPANILGDGTDETLLDTLVVISIPPSLSAIAMTSYPFPETILMDSLDVVYCDTITTIVTNEDGVSLANVPVEYSIATEDQQYGTLSAYADTTQQIPGVIFNGARTVFCTYPNISLNDEEPTVININVIAPYTDPLLTNDVAINLVEDLPECPDCQASLTLTSQYYELPTGDNNEIVTTQITATVIDTTENPVPAFTLVEFESVTLDEDGNLVPNGSIEPYKFTDENGQAVATFNMETDVGLTQIIGTAPSYNLADTIYINLTSTDATSIQLVPPTPNEITVQGGGGIEATQLTMEIKDGSDNLVTEPFLVHFRILETAPFGVYLNDQDEDYLVECAESSNGQATVTLNSGGQPGSVPIRAELYPADLGVSCSDIDESTYSTFGIAALESVPVTVVTGAPAFGEINYSYVEISPIGGGQYELPLSVSLWDFYSNPVADSTNVFIWVEGIANPWSADSVYTFGDSVKWGGLDETGQVIEVDSLVYVWNSEGFSSNTPGLNNPSPGDGLEILGTPLWREVQHPGSIIGAAETGMESPDGISYPGIAWSSVRFGTASVFENTVIKALCYDADGQKLIIDGRDSHGGDGLVLPCYNCVLSDPAVTPGFVDFSLIGDVGLNDLDDTVEVTISSGLTDYYQYPVNNGTLQAVATGATFWSACDPADTDLDGFVGCCNSFDIIGGTGSGSGDGICDDESPFQTCTDCVANGGVWIPDAAQDDPNVFGTQINGPNDLADDPAFGNTNGNGSVVWTASYSEVLNIGDGNDPESYDTWPSQITIFLLDPLQVSSSTLTYEIFKTEQNDNP